MEEEAGCIQSELVYDEACVTLKSEINIPNLWLYRLSSDCVECPYTRTTELLKSVPVNITVKTAHSQFWRIIETPNHEDFIPATNTYGLFCELSPDIGQYGVYELTANDKNNCTFHVHEDPLNPYTPLGIGCGAIILLLAILSIGKLIKNRMSKRGSDDVTSDKNATPVKRRVRSLDTVRGMSILLMIFVNNGSAGYQILEHATWNGLLVGDLVFPCFMWIMGVCIPLSISSQLSRGTSRLSVCRAIVKRSIYLFFIGISLNTLGGYTQLENIRVFGVLQRFSVSYLITGVVYALAVPTDSKDAESPLSRSIPEILMLIPQWVIALLILTVHCGIIFFLPVTDCPKGYLGPGGRHADGKYLNCSGGATGYVDKVLLGVNHIYQLPTANSVYGSGPFDPEGVLGCLTSIFQVFLGIQAGQILRQYREWKQRLARWMIWAVILGILGAILHFSDAIPINKNLWSISFVMVTTCFCLTLLSVSYLLIDVIDIWEGGPFRIPGMNALVMYVGHQVFYNVFPFHWRIGEMNTHSWLLAESLWCVGLWTCIAYILHRKRVYVTL